MKDNNIVIRSLIIICVVAVLFMQSCYLFCLFRPEKALEDVVEEFMEGNMGTDDEEPAPEQMHLPNVDSSAF